MGRDRLFGTDGVRGVANTELTAKLAFDLGYSGARVLADISRHRPKILIGKDTRISCDMLEAAIAAGICSSGADAVSIGVIPTPAAAYLTSLYNADAGVVISASHNSFEFNGIKFFDKNGYKLQDSIEDEIEALILAGAAAGSGRAAPTGGDVGRYRAVRDAGVDYKSYLLSFERRGLSGIRLALDCANGAASHIARDIFETLGARVFPINNEPDGININDRCGSTHLDAIRKHTADCGADIGIAFDGDADRMLAVDERGRDISGDAIIALLAIDMHKNGKLRGDTVVTTVMSNLGLEIAVRRHGIKLVRTAVGDRYVLEEMLKNGYALGGENSGHIICLDENTTGDGLIAALKLLGVLYGGAGRGRIPVSQMTGVIKTVPQILMNAKVLNKNKATYLDDPVIRQRCSDIEARFDGEGRVLIRPSGTEPLIRVMIEAGDGALIKSEAEGLVRLIEERLG